MPTSVGLYSPQWVVRPVQGQAPHTLRQLNKNLGVVVSNKAHRWLQSHNLLRSNALILSSALLCASRMLTDYYFAKKAKGTPDEGYRYREFVGTVIREAGGWTLSFLVLRVFETIIKAYLTHKLVLHPPPQGGWRNFGKLFSEAKQEIAAYLRLKRGKPLGNYTPVVQKWRPNHYESYAVYDQAKNLAAFEKLPFWQQKIIGLFRTRDPNRPDKMLENFYNWFPFAAGFLPTVALSGWALERFKQRHVDNVLDVLTFRHQGKRTDVQNAWLSPQRFYFYGFLQSVAESRVSHPKIANDNFEFIDNQKTA